MISAVVHTFNEEKNIERCLASLTWVDEIVLVDMGSSDKTCQIAQGYGALIFTHPHIGFVEPARNFGLEKAKGTWIIIVDADEEIGHSLAKYLKIEVDKPAGDFYRLARKNIIFGKWIKNCGWWPDYQVRFFKKGAVSWSDKIHGIPLTHGTGIDIEATEDLSIIHYNYQTIEQYIQRLNRYSSISAKQLYLENEHFKFTQLVPKMTGEFVNRYFVWQGYKDGIHGLVLSLLQSFDQLATYLKLWELEKFKEERITLDEVRLLLSKEHKTKQYWFWQEKLNKSHNFFQDLIWRIKQKLNTYG